MKNTKITLLAAALFALACAVLFAGKAVSHEPKLLAAAAKAGVLICANDDIKTGTTAVKAGSDEALKKFTIKSGNGKAFKVIKYTCIICTQALDAGGNEISYNSNIYRIQKAGLAKINALIKGGKIGFMELATAPTGRGDMENSSEGDDSPPDENRYVKLRRVTAYNILVMDSAGKQVTLQLVSDMSEASHKLR